MQSLVKKLKGVVEDDTLRKIDEVEIKFEVFGIDSATKGSYNYDLLLETNSNISIRKSREELQVKNNNNNTIEIDNIQDGDAIFISPAPSYIPKLTTRAKSDGIKNMRVTFEGLYNDSLQNNMTFVNGLINLDKLNKNIYLKNISFYFASRDSASYIGTPDVIVDIKDISEKFTNLEKINIQQCKLGFKNYEYFRDLNKLKDFNIYSIYNNKLDLKVEYLSNVLSISAVGIQLSGNAFSAIDNHMHTKCSFNGTFKYEGQTFENTKFDQMGGSEFYVDGNVDLMLNNLANNVYVYGNSAATITIGSFRTSASNSAIQTLQSKGYTISIPGGSTLSEMSLMSVMSMEENTEQRYRIAYQGKQLIVEPTVFPIYPAAGVTVKEFMTLEEANEFISENNLSTDL